ncbi:MAG: hypothetical protein U1E65_21410 [Myxococcota bacterium]
MKSRSPSILKALILLLPAAFAVSGCGGGTEACSGDSCPPVSVDAGARVPGPEGFIQPIPAAPKCYTPCRGDLAQGGQILRCGADGLLPGCIGGNTCVNGTCMPPAGKTGSGLTAASGAGLEPGSPCDSDETCGKTADGRDQVCIAGACEALCGVRDGTCNSDQECPDFQICIEGHCFSNCETNADCPAPGACFRHACRLTCSTSGRSQTCPAGRTCVSDDGTHGFCMPAAPPAAAAAPPADGTFELHRDGVSGQLQSLPFTNIATSLSFTIENHSRSAKTFKIKKLSHVETKADGTTNTVTANALNWIQMGVGATTMATQELEVTLDAPVGNTPTTAIITLDHASNPNYAVWEGTIQVSNPSLGQQTINLSYRSTPSGRWRGSMYYFNLFGSDGLNTWANLRPRTQQLDPNNYIQVKNAFIQQWVGFKRGDNFDVNRFKAMIQATQIESYEWPLMKQFCPEVGRKCYPYDNTQGYFEYTSNVGQFPIPQGMSELPIAMDLTADPAALTSLPGVPTDASGWSGRIVSDTALHYAGDPKINLAFTTDPVQCPKTAAGSTLCQLEGFHADIAVGGNYLPEAGDNNCAHAPGGPGTYDLVNVPWLIPGFLAGTSAGTNNQRTRAECRDKMLPLGVMAAEQNRLLATSNPIPDGRTRSRSLEMIDGFLLDQQNLIIIFREVMPSFLGTGDSSFSTYGLMILNRAATSLTPDAFMGNAQADTRVQNEDLLRVSCSQELIDGALGIVVPPGPHAPMPTDAAGLANLSDYVMGAVSPGQGLGLPINNEAPHYLCIDTGQFDGGSATNPVPCPPQSRVVFFTLTNFNLDLRAEACNASYADTISDSGTRQITATGRCEAAMTSARLLAYHPRLNPVYHCNDGTAFCDQNRYNLLDLKTFYAEPPVGQPKPMLPLETAVDLAFQYKSKFQARSGKSLGFAPVICAPGQEYCYDPVAVERVRDRVDCLTHIYVSGYTTLSQASGAAAQSLTRLQNFLTKNFAYAETRDPLNNVKTRDGFERLNAELLVMLGDDAYTAAFASRFDLAGANLRSFPGTDLEGPDGINLSGGAGFEMVTLYESTQYYQLALERFYRLAPQIWQSISLPQTFVGNQTVSSYFARVIRASTQKARAFSEIARRYQDLNRPNLARRVVQRAYTAAYLEGMVISSLIDKLRAHAVVQDLAEINQNLRDAAQRYRSALLDMADLNRTIRDEQTFFGYKPDYIPFPPIGFLETGEVNAFQKLIASAEDKMAVAADKEEIALANKRAFDTDAAAFQSELRQLDLGYAAQLGDVCGTFTGDDGRIYPATADFAYLSKTTKSLGDPCGRLGNGQLFQDMAAVDIAQIELKKALQAQANTLSAISIEKDRIAQYCDAVTVTLNYIEDEQSKSISMLQGIQAADAIKSFAERARDTAAAALETGGAAVAIAAVAEPFILGADIATKALEVEREKVANNIANVQIEKMCDYATVDSNAVVANLWLDMLSHDLEILGKVDELKLAVSAVTKDRNLATRLIQDQRESEQLAIDVEAARNDPNARIYKNDDILTADRTFRDAVREAYKATKVYEYYTSQTYAHLGDLFLVRLVAHGDVSLENYVANLKDAFVEFQDRFGNPDVRVQIVSLRDDILGIPRINPATNAAVCNADRVALFRSALEGARHLDDRGYLSFTFPTQLAALSPLTRNHKIYYVEAEYVGTDVGDAVGRVYLTNKGTSTVRRVDGDKSFYAFPQRTAVVNTFFNGERAFFDNTRVTDVYANFRLRDLPLANSSWELVLNTKDEPANLDINLRSLEDVRLYFYYSDFSEP